MGNQDFIRHTRGSGLTSRYVREHHVVDGQLLLLDQLKRMALHNDHFEGSNGITPDTVDTTTQQQVHPGNLVMNNYWALFDDGQVDENHQWVGYNYYLNLLKISDDEQTYSNGYGGRMRGQHCVPVSAGLLDIPDRQFDPWRRCAIHGRAFQYRPQDTILFHSRLAVESIQTVPIDEGEEYRQVQVQSQGNTAAPFIFNGLVGSTQQKYANLQFLTEQWQFQQQKNLNTGYTQMQIQHAGGPNERSWIAFIALPSVGAINPSWYAIASYGQAQWTDDPSWGGITAQNFFDLQIPVRRQQNELWQEFDITHVNGAYRFYYNGNVVAVVPDHVYQQQGGANLVPYWDEDQEQGSGHVLMTKMHYSEATTEEEEEGDDPTEVFVDQNLSAFDKSDIEPRDLQQQ